MNPQLILSMVARPGAERRQGTRQDSYQGRYFAVSDVTGAARRFGPSVETTARKNIWLAALIALTALLVLGNLVSDGTLALNYGWDVRVHCAAVDAQRDGLAPYFVTQL